MRAQRLTVLAHRIPCYALPAVAARKLLLLALGNVPPHFLPRLLLHAPSVLTFDKQFCTSVRVLLVVHKLPHPLTATVGALYLQSRSYVIKDDVNVQCGATWENLFAERAFW